MKSLRVLLWVAVSILLSAHATAQTVTLEGLRSAAGAGSFQAAQYAPDGSLILLYDQGDGLRLLKTDAAASTITAQTHNGATGDSGVALAVDPTGNIYVAGTSTSGMLPGTAGAPFPAPADTTTNSFIAKFDSNLNLLFLSFLGSGKTVVTGVAASSDGVFVTGVTYIASLPVTSTAAQQSPAEGSAQNGFVERFSTDGAALTYATYLTGTGGDTIPSGIAVDASDDAYIAGLTSAPGFPTTASALQPRILGSTSGFLAKLTPAGDGFIDSTFLAGAGLTSIAIDGASNTLLLSGNIAPGQFPITTVTGPVANTPYQTLLRLSEDGQSVLNSQLLVPGPTSSVSAGPGGTAWVSGSLDTPLWPGTTTPSSPFGDSFLLHVSAANAVDAAFRFGGIPIANASYASLTSDVGPPLAGTVDGSAVLPGTLTSSATTSLFSNQTFDLPLTAAPTSALPNSGPDLVSAPCTGTGQCSGSAGLLAMVTTQTGASTSLSLSTGDGPNLTLRNAGSVSATGLVLTASGFTVATDCGSTLPPATQCAIALTGAGPGTLTASAGNAPTLLASLSANTATPDALALSAAELDFGIVTGSSALSRTVTVTNLSDTAQTFTSVMDAGPTDPPYSLAETASTCTGTPAAHSLAPDSSCSVTLTLAASTSGSNDGIVSAAWKIGPRDLAITGITQAASISVSAAEIDFGTQFVGITPQLPRYLFLSNPSPDPVPHTAVALPSNSPFTLTDNCPATLAAGTVCQIAITYTQTAAPSQDSTTLTLDDGIEVLITGATLPAASSSGTGTNPSLSVSPASLNFANSVVVTGVSSETQALTLTNSGNTALPLTVTVTGDFTITNNCGTLINAGSSCLLIVQFTPSQPGERNGLLSLTAGSGFAPVYVSLSAIASPLLPANNGTLALGQTFIGEPTVAWYKLQAPVASLSASVSGAGFGVAFLPDENGTHGSVPAAGFAPSVTAACPDCWLAIQFLPTSVAAANGTLTLSSASGGKPYQLALTGAAAPVQGLVLTPISQDFGPVAVGSSSAPLTFTLANLLSPAQPATVESLAATGDFSVTQNATGGAACTGTLASTASCYVTLSFNPTANGTRSGTLTVTTSAGTATASLTGTGSPATGLSITPASLSFTNQPGTGATQQTLTLTNNSTNTLTIGSITSSSTSFTPVSACGSLAPTASCTIAITFTPGASEVSATLSIPASINSEHSTSTYTVPLTGSYTANQAGLLLLPAQANFGSQDTGALGQTREFTLLNTSAQTEAVSISAPRNFPLSARFTCATLAAGASCTFSVSFLPASAGTLTGSLVANATQATGNTLEAIAYLAGYATGSAGLTLSSSGIPGSPGNFGQVTSGQTAQQTFTLTNTGSSTLNLRRIVTSPPFYPAANCGQPLGPGASCIVTVTYAPTYLVAGTQSTSAPRTDTATLAIESDAVSSPDTVTLTGSVSPLLSSSTASAPLPSYTLSQGALTFANTPPGSTSTAQILTLLNIGTSTLSFGNPIISADFQATSTCSTLNPGQGCTLSVTFAPGSTNASTVRAGTLEIPSNAGNALDFVSLLGLAATAPLSVTPSPLDFGTVDLGSTAQLSITVTNNAPLPVPFGSMTVSGDYAISSTGCPASGNNLTAAQSCTATISFSPTATGTRPGTLTVGTLSIPLTGTGAQPPSFALTVNGATTATATVGAGQTASYALALTPLAGYTGAVAVTCIALTPGPYAACALSNTQLTLNGSALSDTATITTSGPGSGAAGFLLLGPLLLLHRRHPKIRGAIRAARLCSAALATFLLCCTGCGSSANSSQSVTPPGTYQYQVQATSLSGPQVTSTVTLTVIVQ